MYVNNDLEEKLESLKEWTKIKEKKVQMVIRGDFNTRTGEKRRRSQRRARKRDVKRKGK